MKPPFSNGILQKEPVLDFQKGFILTNFLWSVKNATGPTVFKKKKTFFFFLRGS